MLDKFFLESFRKQCLTDITESEVEQIFAKRTKILKPKEDMLKKALQYTKAIFQFAIRQKWCTENPAMTVDLSNLYSLCNLQVKTDDEKQFSPEEIDEILNLAKALEGESIYVFHDPNGEWVKADGYGHYLAKRCCALGIQTTNNHAFRMALNNYLISQEIDARDRALLLGHSVETNERHYSLTDTRRLADIRSRLLSAKKGKPDSQ